MFVQSCSSFPDFLVSILVRDRAQPRSGRMEAAMASSSSETEETGPLAGVVQSPDDAKDSLAAAAAAGAYASN